jgi:ArsR family transcriptional regulator
MTMETCIAGLEIEDAAQAFAALGSEQRLVVLRALVRAGPDGLRVGELKDRTGLAASTLSHHLRFLSQAGLIEQTRRGREIICAGAAYQRVEALAAFLMRECCADAPCDHRHAEHAK